MKRLYSRLPGPPAVKALLLIALIVVAVVALGFLFEWAGDLLDSGGVIGDSPS
jgi:Tfp pilus assembly protein PilO